MKETLESLESAGVYYLATSKDNIPYVRPFGTINLYKNKLYIQIGKVKNCYKEDPFKVFLLTYYKNHSIIKIGNILHK